MESAGGVVHGDQGQATTVRGQPGDLVRSGQVEVEGPSRDDVVVVTWSEGGTELRASFRGLGIDDGLAALSRLQVRAGGLAGLLDCHEVLQEAPGP